MKNRVKNICLSAAVVALTACGGGSGGTSTGTSGSTNGGQTTGGANNGGTQVDGNSGKKLIKETQYNGTDAFMATIYSYNANGLVSKSVTTNYKGDSEQGDLIHKTNIEYTYEKTYNMVKVISKGYDENDKLISESTSLQTYNGDKIATSHADIINYLNRDTDMTSDGNFTDYSGPIPTKTTLATYNKEKKLTSLTNSVSTVSENKDVNTTSTTISYLSTPKTTVHSAYLRKYDSLDRNIEITMTSPGPGYSMKSIPSYDDNRNIKEPKFVCFGGYVQLAKNHRNKYPKAENLCYLKSGLKSEIDMAALNNKTTSKLTYENTIRDGVITQRKVMKDDVLQTTYTYEYE